MRLFAGYMYDYFFIYLLRFLKMIRDQHLAQDFFSKTTLNILIFLLRLISFNEKSEDSSEGKKQAFYVLQN